MASLFGPAASLNAAASHPALCAHTAIVGLLVCSEPEPCSPTSESEAEEEDEECGVCLDAVVSCWRRCGAPVSAS